MYVPWLTLSVFPGHYILGPYTFSALTKIEEGQQTALELEVASIIDASTLQSSAVVCDPSDVCAMVNTWRPLLGTFKYNHWYIQLLGPFLPSCSWRRITIREAPSKKDRIRLMLPIGQHSLFFLLICPKLFSPSPYEDKEE